LITKAAAMKLSPPPRLKVFLKIALIVVLSIPVRRERHDSVFIVGAQPFDAVAVMANIGQYFHLEDNVISVELVKDAEDDFQPENEVDHYDGKINRDQLDGSSDGSLQLLSQLDRQLSEALQRRPGAKWRYSVIANEYFSHLPSIFVNKNVGTLTALRNGADKWTVEANFWTPVVLWLGVDSNNVQTFEKTSVDGKEGTLVTEKLDYQCLLGLVWLCNWEAEEQRTKVLKNLLQMLTK